MRAAAYDPTMSRDWNIVDDEAPTEPQAEDDARLNLHRVRLLTLDRRAAARGRQWTVAVAMLSLLSAMILLARAIGWLAADRHRRWAVAAFALAGALIFVALKLGRRLRRSAIAQASSPLTAPEFQTLSDGSQRREGLRALGSDEGPAREA